MLKKPIGFSEPPRFTHFVPSQYRIASFDPFGNCEIGKLTVAEPVSDEVVVKFKPDWKVDPFGNGPGRLLPP